MMEAKKKCKRLQEMGCKKSKCDNTVSPNPPDKIPIYLIKRPLIPYKWSSNRQRSMESNLLWARIKPQIMNDNTFKNANIYQTKTKISLKKANILKKKPSFIILLMCNCLVNCALFYLRELWISV